MSNGAAAAPPRHVEPPQAESRAEAPPAVAQRQAGVVIRWWSASLIMRGWHPRKIEVRRPWRARLSEAAVGVLDRIADWQERARARRALLSLDDHVLRDVGIDRATAHYVGALPFWRRHE